MPEREIKYEVLVGSGNRWTIDSIHAASTVAMSRAQALLASNQHDAVRVTRDVEGRQEEVIFQQECAPQSDRPITVTGIEEAAACDELVDLCGFPARKTAGRVLRKYLDEYNLTALEVLHDHDHLRELRRTANLFDQAVHKVGSVQARAAGGPPQERIDLLYRLGTALTDETRDMRGTKRFIDILDSDGLTAALRAIGTSFSEEARAFHICGMLASYAGRARDWSEKIKLVFDQLEKPADEEARSYLDEICAEIMDGSTAVREILGAQPDLISALRVMAQLAAGRYAKRGRGDALLVRFNRILHNLPMPATKAVLLERIERAAGGTALLTREDENADRIAFPPLVKDLIAAAGLSGGPGISEAVTKRARIVMRTGDSDLTPAAGIAFIESQLPNNAVKIGYLLDLSRSPFGSKHQAPVLGRLLEIVRPIESLEGLLPPRASREELAATVEDLRQRVGDDALGQEIGELIAKKFDTIFGDETKPATAKALQPAPEPEKKKTTTKDANNRAYKAGDVIFREGDPGDEAFMIMSGEVQIAVGTDDRQATIATLGRGEVLGEMAMVDDQPRMATATALKDTTVYVVPQEIFKKQLSWLAEEDRLLSHIIETLVGRLRGQFIGGNRP